MHQVYIISVDNVVVYVGRTMHLSNRLRAFKKRTGIVDFSVRIITCKDLADAMVTELRTTDELKPTLMRRRVSSYGAIGASYSKEERECRSKRMRANNPGSLPATRKASAERMLKLNTENNPQKSEKNRERMQKVMLELNRKRRDRES